MKTEQTLKCEICGSAESPLMAPVMTGVPFSAPFEKQRFVCGDCFYVWNEYGATTREKIKELRGRAPTTDMMLKPLGRVSFLEASCQNS